MQKSQFYVTAEREVCYKSGDFLALLPHTAPVKGKVMRAGRILTAAEPSSD
jgi:hypothetical protein